MPLTHAPHSWSIACLSLGLVAPALAQTDESLLLAPWKDDHVVESSTDLILLNRSHYDTPDTHASFFEVESTGRYRLDTSRELNPTLGYDWTHIGTSDNRSSIPTSLDDLSLAVASPLAMVGDWFIGASAGVGYAGKSPFGDGRGWYGKGSVMTGTQFDNDNALVLFIDYDGNRTFLPDLPIPGFAYAGKLDENLKYAVGFPINAVIWTPADDLEFSLSSYIFTTFDARAVYKLTHEWKIFARYVNEETAFNDSDLPADRRLFYLETRAEGGVGYSLSDNFDLEVGIGYAFARQFETGFDDRDLTKITDVSDEPYVRLGLAIHY